MAIPCDDHMVVDSDAKQPANFSHLFGHIDIGPGWRGVAGRVIVDEDTAGGMELDCSPENLARIYQRVVHRPARGAALVRLVDARDRAA